MMQAVRLHSRQAAHRKPAANILRCDAILSIWLEAVR